MKAANSGGHRFALILGPDEFERGVVQLKDLDAKAQREVALADVVGAVRDLVPAGAR